MQLCAQAHVSVHNYVCACTCVIVRVHMDVRSYVFVCASVHVCKPKAHVWGPML